MKHRARLVLLLTLALGACRVAPASTPVPRQLKPATTVDTVQATGTSAGPTATPGHLASVTPSGRPTARPLASLRLAKPSTPSTMLSGTVTIDASYVVSAGAGSLVSNNAGNVLAAGSARLGPDGKLVATADGSVIAEASGNLISDSGGGMISDSGGGLVSEHGAGIVANNGGGLVANNAGNLIGKTKRQLLDTGSSGAVSPGTGASSAASPGALAYGALLPAAGVQVAVRSLATGKLVPVGVDGNNQPVYSVYTNLAGGYQLYVPASEQGNLLVEAQLPHATDSRQAYSLVATPGKPQVVDEDTAMATRFLRQVFVSRMIGLLRDDPAVTLCEIDSSHAYSDSLKQLLTAALQDFHARSVKAGITGDPAQGPAVLALALRCADFALSTLQMDQVQLGGDSSAGWGSAPGEHPETVNVALVEVLRTIRLAATAKLAKDPHYFNNIGYFVDANACDPGRYKIEKPADFNAFMISEYMGNNSDPGLNYGHFALDDLNGDVDGDGVVEHHKLSACLDAVTSAIAHAVFAGDGTLLDQLHALINTFDPKATPVPQLDLPDPARTPCPRDANFEGHQYTDCASSPGPSDDASGTPAASASP